MEQSVGQVCNPAAESGLRHLSRRAVLFGELQGIQALVCLWDHSTAHPSWWVSPPSDTNTRSDGQDNTHVQSGALQREHDL